MSVIDQLAYLSAIPAPDDIQTRPEQRARWMWATVTQVSPLRVRLDGQSQALDMTPISLVDGLRINRRVRVQLVEKQLIVTGVAASDAGWVDVPLMSGFSSRGAAYTPQVRKDSAGMVTWRGHMSNSGFSGTGSTAFADIPAGYEPEMEVRFLAWQTNRSYVLGGWISTSGSVNLQMPDGPPATHFALIMQPWQAA